jgi:hypothetical protein
VPFYNLRPTATGDYNAWALGAGVSKPAAVDPGDYPGAHDDHASFISVAASPGGGNTHQSFLLAPPPKTAAMVALLCKVRARHATLDPEVESISVFARMSGVDGASTPIAPGTGYTDYSLALARPGGGTWSIADLENATLQVGVLVPADNADVALVTTLYLELEYLPADPGDGREIATAALRIRRRPIPYSSLDVGPAILDNELMDDLSLTHYAHPLSRILGEQDPDGFWRPGDEGWQRVLVQFREIETDLNTLQSVVTLRDRRWDLVTFYDSAESRRSPASIEDGVAVLTTGGRRVYSRDGNAWLEDPASGLVVRFDPQQRTIGKEGFQPENFATQWLARSSMVSGITGLSHFGSGTHAIEVNPPDPLFDPAVVPNSQCLLLTAGSPHSADAYEAWPDTATIPANTVLRLSIDHKDDPSASLYWLLRRTLDGFYWDDSSGAWGAAIIWNPLPLRTTRARDKSARRIPVGGTSTVAQFRLQQPTGGVAGRVNRVYHAQLEDNGVGHVTGRIVTDATAPAARQMQTYTVQNIAGHRAFNNGHGTFFCEVIPSWDAADMNVAGNFPPLFELRYDANNYWLLYYDGPTNNTLRFEAKVGGIAAGSSFLNWVPVAGTKYIIAARWLGAEGAFGYPAHSHHVFAGLPGSVTKGSDPVRAGEPVVADGLLYIGTAATGVAWNGIIRRILFSQAIYSDAEIKAGRW